MFIFIFLIFVCFVLIVTTSYTNSVVFRPSKHFQVFKKGNPGLVEAQTKSAIHPNPDPKRYHPTAKWRLTAQWRRFVTFVYPSCFQSLKTPIHHTHCDLESLNSPFYPPGRKKRVGRFRVRESLLASSPMTTRLDLMVLTMSTVHRFHRFLEHGFAVSNDTASWLLRKLPRCWLSWIRNTGWPLQSLRTWSVRYRRVRSNLLGEVVLFYVLFRIEK